MSLYVGPVAPPIGTPSRIHCSFVATGAGAATLNTVAGEVLQVSPLGEVIQYLVKVTDETSLLIRRPAHGAVRLSPGDQVLCGWAAEDVRLFPLDTPSAPTTARSTQ